MLPLLLLGIGVMKAIDESSTASAEAKRNRQLVLRQTFERVASKRRIGEKRINYDDEGVRRDALCYYPAQWNPAPWVVLVWTDPGARAEVFTFVPHPVIEQHGGANFSVYWNEAADPDLDPGDTIQLRSTRKVREDDKFANRSVHRYEGRGGTFVLRVQHSDEVLRFYHRPRTFLTLPALPKKSNKERSTSEVEKVVRDVLAKHHAKSVNATAPDPALREPPPAPYGNPFVEVMERDLQVDRQYREASEFVHQMNLAMDVKERLFERLTKAYRNATRGDGASENPFAGTVERVIALETQYEEATRAVRERHLPANVEEQVLAELERIYTDQLADMDEERER